MSLDLKLENLKFHFKENRLVYIEETILYLMEKGVVSIYYISNWAIQLHSIRLVEHLRLVCNYHLNKNWESGMRSGYLFWLEQGGTFNINDIKYVQKWDIGKKLVDKKYTTWDMIIANFRSDGFWFTTTWFIRVLMEASQEGNSRAFSMLQAEIGNLDCYEWERNRLLKSIEHHNRDFIETKKECASIRILTLQNGENEEFLIYADSKNKIYVRDVNEIIKHKYPHQSQKNPCLSFASKYIDMATFELEFLEIVD